MRAQNNMAEPLQIQDQIAIAVSLAEGQFREFKTAYKGTPSKKIKRSVREISRDVAEALVAFANADGGELIIGVEDDGVVTGPSDFLDTEIQEIKAAATTHVHKDTPLQSVLCRETIIDNKRVIYFRVSKGTRYIHLTSDGRCLQRNDLETIPVAAERIQFSRREVISREYDREFVDGASVKHLNSNMLKAVAEQISKGMSIDKCLQYLGLADYQGNAGLRLRRAALLLFSLSPDDWHPRIQARILKVNGTILGVGSAYNVVSDITVKGNILSLIDSVWEALRIHLVATRFDQDAKFKSTVIYPERACREALINAIAHRDYSEEGRGIEIYIFDDRIEISNPGGVLSSISLDDIRSLTGAHQSRNAYIARTLRELGFMRELGEGMRRIFDIMKSSELTPPALEADSSSFYLKLYNKPFYDQEEILWLEQYESLHLSAEEKATMLLGRRGDLIAPNDIIRRLGIVDIEHYRKVVHSLQQKHVLQSAITKSAATQIARKKSKGVRDVPRFRIKTAKEIRSRNLNVLSTKIESREAESRAITKHDFDESRTLYIGNIPIEMGEEDILAALHEYKQPADILIPRKGGKHNGYGFIEFENEEIVQEILIADIALGGRKLVSRRKRPRSFEKTDAKHSE